MEEERFLKESYQGYIIASLGRRNSYDIQTLLGLEDWEERKMEAFLQERYESDGAHLFAKIEAAVQAGMSFSEYVAELSGGQEVSLEDEEEPLEESQRGMGLLAIEEAILEEMRLYQDKGSQSANGEKLIRKPEGLSMHYFQHLAVLYQLVKEGYGLAEVEKLKDDTAEALRRQFGGNY